MKKHKVKVCVVTGSRSEFGLLKPLLRKIKKDSDLELNLVVTGFHLLKYGGSIEEINKEFGKYEKVEMYCEGDGKTMYVKGLGRGISNFSETFYKIKPNIVVVVGDRLEALAASMAASLQKIPVMHIQAGDLTYSGHIDDKTRFAISRFSHILCAANENHKKRLIKIGEEPWRIFVTGSLNVDAVLEAKKITKEDLWRKLKLDPSKDTIIFLYNPVEWENNYKIVHRTIKTLLEQDYQIVAILPNADPGSESVIKAIMDFKKNPRMKIYKNLNFETFVNLMRHSKFMIGNSSSGIIEAPSLGLPYIHIGKREIGRDHASNVIFLENLENLKKTLKQNSDKKSKKYNNPYGNGGSAERVITIIKEFFINEKVKPEKLLHKKILL